MSGVLKYSYSVPSITDGLLIDSCTFSFLLDQRRTINCSIYVRLFERGGKMIVEDMIGNASIKKEKMHEIRLLAGLLIRSNEIW